MLLQALHLLFKLLIAVLQLLDLPGEAADRFFHPIDPRHQLGIGILRLRGVDAERADYRNRKKRERTDHPGDIFAGFSVRTIAGPASKL